MAKAASREKIIADQRQKIKRRNPVIYQNQFTFMQKFPSPFFMILLLFLSSCRTNASPGDVVQSLGFPKSGETETAIQTLTISESPNFTHTPTAIINTTLPPDATVFQTNTSTITPQPGFAFVVNADMIGYTGSGEFDTQQHFRGLCEAVSALGNAAFMISVGDTTPPEATEWTVKRYLGEDFLWLPVVGNHELGEREMEWLRNYDYDPNGAHPPNIVNYGPEGCEQTTFSFDYENSHFVILNVYCDLGNDTRTDGAIVDALYDWLVEDFDRTEQEHIFVFGHEPAFPQPDADNGIIRHLGDSLDQYPYTRDRFWKLLSDRNVVAYFTG
ncbi:MAG: metallophosphoesterase, partial [Anaerolineaceae bacterium]|nr:metallophosphoesterase [Anaerolineaceae bacterium]